MTLLARQMLRASRGSVRTFATSHDAATRHDLLIVGGGTAGINVANQIKSAYLSNDREPPKTTIIDGADRHHYQPGWTLVGAGLASKSELNRSMEEVVPAHAKRIAQDVVAVDPDTKTVTLADGQVLGYRQLVLCPGIRINYDGVTGLREALDTDGVGTIYDYDYCDKVYQNIQSLEKGRAVFTHPAGDVKCAGAPQKIMWMAEDYWRRQGRRSGDIQVEFHTNLPQMFGVKKYSDVLKGLTEERDVTANFRSVLKKVDSRKRVATFATGDKGEEVERQYDFLHAVPPMAPHEFIKKSKVANANGFVDVDQKTLRSTKYNDVWSLGDASSLATSKTAAAIMSQAPILAHNFYLANEGKVDLKDDSSAVAHYDGYTSCPLLTSYGGLLLAEFGYGGEIKETFTKYGLDQSRPSRWAYHLKKDVFPRVYFGAYQNGNWYGRNGPFRPSFT